jgi:hypothetical protein
MWKRLLKRCHPDAGGDAELFVWCRELQSHVSGDHIEQVPPCARRDPPRHTSTGDRIPFEPAPPFGVLTDRALDAALDVGEPYADLLGLLWDCVEVRPDKPILWRQQQEGATYKSLAALAYRANMSKYERIQWYRISESIPLTQRHVGHMLSKVD